MNDPENFLTRWSRRKRETEAPDPGAPAGAEPDATAQDDEADAKPTGKHVAARSQDPKAAPNAEAEPEFDPASLPSIDSIGAQTDISAFLKPGVPGDLKLAALRRAWTMDPAIRDFKGLQDYDWDFTVPGSMPGFGELDPGFDVKKMLGEIFSESPRPEASLTEIPAPQEQLVQPSQEPGLPGAEATGGKADDTARGEDSGEPQQVASAETDKIVQREENIATQDVGADSGAAPRKIRRSQGGALPQ